MMKFIKKYAGPILMVTGMTMIIIGQFVVPLIK